MTTGAIIVRLTRIEAEAAFSEIETAVYMAEANPGPYHHQHHAARRVMKKIKAALARAEGGQP